MSATLHEVKRKTEQDALLRVEDHAPVEGLPCTRVAELVTCHPCMNQVGSSWPEIIEIYQFF